MVDVRELLGAPVLAPRDRLVPVVDERGMRPALLDEAPLEIPVVVGVERLLGVHRVEVGAPAAPEHAVVALREPGEAVPGVRG